MLLITLNGVDVTAKVDRNTIRLTEQLNNRSNTLSFAVTNQGVSEGQFVDVFEYTTLTQDALNGQPILDVFDTFEISEKFDTGDLILIGINEVEERKYEILSVNHTTKQITLTENLLLTYSKGIKVGRKIFGGNVNNAPEKERTQGECSPIDTERSVSCTDYNKLFDRKIVVETFENQYVREIIGRIVYEFCANDDEVIIDELQTAWTNSGVALAMVSEQQDRIQGTFCQKTGTSGAGIGTRSQVIPSEDISLMKHLRFRLKIRIDQGVKVNSLKIRIGGGVSDYFEYNISKVGFQREDHWSYDSMILGEYDNLVGSPSFSSITYVAYVIDCNDAIPTGEIFFDVVSTTLGGFTIVNVARSGTKFEDVRVQYKKPSVIVENFAKLQGDFRYIDYDRDLNYFSKLGNTPSPFSITDTSQNFSELSIEADITNLKNRQTVRGGEAPDQLLYTQDEVSDGEEESYRLDYKPKSLEIYVDAGSGFIQKTVGTENLDEFGSPLTITNATRLAGIATITSPGHGYSNGNLVVLSGILPGGYNGEFTISNVTLNTFDVSILVNPGVYISGGATSLALDFIFNFQEKIVKRKNHPQLASGDIFRRVYYPYKPIRVRVRDATSIAMMQLLTKGDGIYDGSVIVEPKIQTFQEARQRARAEVNLYKNPQITCTFLTNYDRLHPGQLLHIEDIDRGIDDDFLIQKVSWSSRENDYRVYNVTAATSLYGIIEFFQLLLKRTDKFSVDVSEVVDVVENVDETITIQDSVLTYKQTAPFRAGDRDVKVYDFIFETGTRVNSLPSALRRIGKPPTQWQCIFVGGETGMASFDISSRYNKQKSLKLQTNIGGTGKALKASNRYRRPLKPSNSYKLKARLELSTLTNQGATPGAFMRLYEYANKSGGASLNTRVLFSGITTLQDYKYYETTFTSGAGSNFYDIEFILQEAIGVASIAHIYLEDQTADSVQNPGIASFSQAS